jgi:hypothetical protein
VLSIAGSSRTGYSDATGAEAYFNSLGGVVCTSDGSRLYACDTENHRIRSIDVSSRAVCTVAGDGRITEIDDEPLWGSIASPTDLVFDVTTSIPDSVLYVAARTRVGFRRLALPTSTARPLGVVVCPGSCTYRFVLCFVCCGVQLQVKC